MPGLVTGIVGGVLLLTPLGSTLEEKVGLAWLFKVRGPVAAPPEVLIVNIDSNSAVKLDQPSKMRDWSRSLHADLVGELVRRDASVIVFDVFFEEARSHIDDNKFAQEIYRAKRVVLFQQVGRQQIDNIIIDTLADPIPAFSTVSIGLAPFPLPKVPKRVSQVWTFYPALDNAPTLPVVALQVHALQSFGYENFLALLKESGFQPTDELPQAVTDSNDLRRLIDEFRAVLKSNPKPLNRLLSRLGEQSNHERSISASDRSTLTALMKTYEGSDSFFLNFYGPAGTLSSIPYSRFFEADEQLAADESPDLSGKVIFVGRMALSFTDQLDGFFTVFSRKDGVDISGVEIAATAYANLLEDRTLRPTGAFTNFGIAFVFGGLLVS